MGTSYDGVYFFGVMFDSFSGDDEQDSWPGKTQTVFDLAEVDDFDEWLERHLGVPDFRTFPGYSAYRSELARRCLEVFGVTGFRQGFLGYSEYRMECVAPMDAWVEEWRGGRCPEFTAEQLATWRVALERLRAVLPGASEPGFHFGCSVG